MTMKYVFYLFLLPVTLYADVGVIVKRTGVVVGKEVYAGDCSKLISSLASRHSSDSSLTFQQFDLTNKTQTSRFNSVILQSETEARTRLQQDLYTIDTSPKTPLEASILDLLKQKGLLK